MVSAELENSLVKMKAVVLDALKYLWIDRTTPIVENPSFSCSSSDLI